MGYAVIDKSRQRDKPPRPPAPRRSRSRSLKTSKKSLNSETKFHTTPRPLKDAGPTRPTRNYSTLGPSRPPRKKSPNEPKEMLDENKENIDLCQYIEIEDDIEEHSRLQSGEVISKMKSRPLPAPPRPPRKTRDNSKEPLHDISFEENIMMDFDEYDKDTDSIPPASMTEAVEEIEVSTQTDPLPDDFICEEVLQEPTDKIVAPRRRRRSTLDSISDTGSRTLDRPKTPLDGAVSPNVMIIERRVQTPTVDFGVDGTVTHASIVVKPVAEYPPDSYVSQRFSADLPEIMSNILISRSTYPEEEILQAEERLQVETSLNAEETEINLQLEDQYTVDSPRSVDTPTTDMQTDEFEQIELEDETVLPSDVSNDIFDDSEYNKYLLESTEEDLIPSTETEIEEEPPAIPEKPLRMRMKQASQELAVDEPQTPTLPSPDVPSPQQPSYQPQIIERIIERPVPFSVTAGPDTEVEVLRAAKLHVTDLDVERLNVGELQAQKILVSEIDGVSLQISELSSKSGSITINGLEIPTGLIQEILEKLQPISQPPTVVEQVSTQTEIVEPELIEAPISEQVSTQTEVSIDTDIIETPLTEQVSTQTDRNSEVVETQTEETPYETKEIPITEQASTQTDIAQTTFKECPVTEQDSTLFEEIEFEKSSGKTDRLLSLEPESSNVDYSIQELIAEQEVTSVQFEDELALKPEKSKIDNSTEQSLIIDKTNEQSEKTLPVESEKNKIEDNIERSVTVQSLKTDLPVSETQKVTKLVTETIDISDSPLSFETKTTHVEDKPESSSEAKKKLEFESETVEKPQNDELIRDVIDDLLSGQISDLQKRIATLQQQMTLESMLDSEDELIPDEPLSEFDESLIPEIIDENASPQDSVVEDSTHTDNISLVTNIDLDPINKDVGKNKNITINNEESEIIEIAESIESKIVSSDKEAAPLKIETTSDKNQNETHSNQRLRSLENIEENKEVLNKSTSDEEPKETEECVKKPIESSKMQRTMSQPIAPSELPHLNLMGGLAQSHVLQGLPYPVSYYPELVQSVTTSYTIAAQPPETLSEEDIPVHHKRRRPLRRLSRSSSEEEPRTISRHARHTRSPEPSVLQLTSQLATASAVSIKRTISHLLHYISTHILGTPEGKQDLQVALILILILIAGLILLGFGGSKTIHLHHWEYFNPPTDL